MYPPIDGIRKDLLESEAAGEIEILGDDRLSFQVFDIEYGRYLRVSKRPMSRAYLASIIHKDPDISDVFWPGVKWIADILSRIDPRETMFLKHIFVVKSEETFLRLVRQHDCDEDMVPENLFDEDGSSSVVGMYWHYESAVIVNWQVLVDCVMDIAGESLWDRTREARIGLASTLVHECRHMTAEAPWFYYSKPLDNSEDAVEEYTRFETDRLIANQIIP